MAKASYIQNSFNSGEVSTLMLGRQDVDKYRSGLFTCFNGLTLAQGPWTRRPGTLFQHTTKFGGDRVSRVLPFQFSVDQNYILEFGHLYVRFHTLGGILIETSQAVEDVTNADPGVITITGHGYANGTRLTLFNFDDGMEELNNVEVIVAASAANTFELTDIYGVDLDTTNFVAWSSGGRVAEIVEEVTSYTESDIAALRVTQSADILYIFSPDFPVTKLERSAPTIWVLTEIEQEDGPYLAENVTTTTLTLSGTTGSVTVTASAIVGINDGVGFLATDIGRLIRFQDPAGDFTWLRITAHGGATSVTATIVGPDASAGTATTVWRLGFWSDTTGYPATGTFFEDRLWTGGVDISPQRLDSSKTGLYENFAPSDPDGTVADDNSVSFTLNSDEVNAIRWMRGDERALLVGTAGGEWAVTPSTLSEATNPTNVSGKQSTQHGSADADAVRAGKSILFIQNAGRKLRELAYVFEADGFKAPDLTLLAEHITRPGMIELAYVENPQSILWDVRSDGTLLGFSYDRDQNVVAWHRHDLGGDSDGAGTPAVVESIASVGSPTGDRDELYLIVQRFINGRTQRHLEVMTKIWEDGDLQDDAFHVDAGFTVVDSPATDTITSLLHLEGETVTPYVDGKNHPDVTVTNGKVTLQIAGLTKSIGYSYFSDGEMLPIEAGAQDGSAQSKTKRIARVGFWLMDTLGLKFGPDPDDLTEVLVRNWGADYGTPTDIFTGVTRERFEGDYDRLGQVYWRCEGPFPCTILAIMPQLTTSDDG